MPTTALGRLRRPAYLAIPLLDGESTDCLASMDASVVVVGRNRSKGEAAVAEIKARSGNEAVELMMADLTSQAEIHRLAKEFEAHYDRLDVLVNNAGAKYAKRWEAAEGIEGTLAIIHLVPVLPTSLLLPMLHRSAPSRIVTVSSWSHRRAKLRLDDLQEKPPRVAVLSLGGTISSTGTGGRSVEPTLSGEDLVANVPQIAEVADVSPESFRQAASGELTLDDLIEVAEEIERRIDGGASGVVVTQGTDSIEETSLVLDLLVDREAPVVVIGAMRNPDLPGADGPANLLASVAVAESGAGLGHARRAQRGDPHRPLCSQDPYPKPGRFPLGTGRSGGLALEGRSAHFATRPSGRRHVALRPGGEDRPVALFTVALGDDGRLLLKISELGYEGLVIEALGGGHVPSVMVEPLAALDREMPVVLASRTGSGEVLRRTYGYPGSETDLLNRGLISAGSLDGFKARLLLSLLLRSGAGREKTEDLFGNWLGHRC